MQDEEIIKYLLKECGGLHPYYIIHILALLDLEYIESTGRKLTGIDYQKSEYGFYSNALPQILEKIGVEKVSDENGNYLKLKNEKEAVHLPEDIKNKVNSILDYFCDLSDAEMHMRVLNAKHYSEL
ncbi:MAG: hypothetical protein GXO25_00465 [Euryarchaeota archaeon]|nr:hypothetical protein [Euryarchaeota archaeon]